ncbi:10020_t:CDS:2 [Gigaspora margarita]|uniref:10020_t:CDS:1 n=1 Tax=Gigaspora margarita TaxID=4874 RepID=A0ABM8VY27_GIGMA|nr:10020_t:CDS:2 [Gigaspora margarita]
MSWGAVLNWNGEKLSDVNGNLSELLQDRNGFDARNILTSLATADEDYNKTSAYNPIPIYKLDDNSETINAVHCDAYFGFGYYCIASISNNQSNVNYHEILFYSEKVIGHNQLQQPPNNINVSWNVSSTPIGGYIFSAVVNATLCL